MRSPRPRGRRVAALALCAAASLAVADCGSAGETPSALLRVGHSTHAGSVAVSPQPGTPDASATTQISFLGPHGTHVAKITVVGSRSGVHSGTLARYSTGTGESFLPARPFARGEQVSVHAVVDENAGPTDVTSAFTVGEPVPYSEKPFPEEPGDPRAVQHFYTLPRSTPSAVKITVPARHGTAPGFLMQAPYQGIGTPGPMISTQAGHLVWFHRLPRGLIATNLHVYQYEGKPVLVWWQGKVLELGFGVGEDVVYDQSYRQVARVRAGNGYRADLHSMYVTNQGTAWVDAFDPVRVNLSTEGGESDGTVSDSIVQEIDIKTGLVMWEWHALGHIALTESHTTPSSSLVGGEEKPWDYVHINSVDPLPDGQVLLSSRNTWALYDVQLSGGGIRWRLGGTRSDFRMGKGTQFYWQHDAQLHSDGRITLFDNAADPAMEPASRALLLRPEPRAHRVRLVRAYVDPTRALLASSQGNMQTLTRRRWMVGYGGLPNFVEYAHNGRVLLEGTLGRGVQSFRTFLQQWSGQPFYPPALAVRRTPRATIVYASWNGATDVSRWRVSETSADGIRSTIAEARANGFETAIELHGPKGRIAVEAVGADGATLGRSREARA